MKIRMFVSCFLFLGSLCFGDLAEEARFERFLKTISPSHHQSWLLKRMQGGLINELYRCDIGSERVVLRLFNPHETLLSIKRHHEYQTECWAAKEGIAPEVLYYAPKDAIMGIRFVPGETLTSERCREPQILTKIIRSIKNLHERPCPLTHVYNPFVSIRQSYSEALRQEIDFPDVFHQAMEQLGQIQEFVAPHMVWKPCHNDLYFPNLLYEARAEKLWLIDWEYAGLGDPLFDLASFVGHLFVSDAQAKEILTTYLGYDPKEKEWARFQLMMTVLELRSAVLLTILSHISSSDYDYMRSARIRLERFFQRIDSSQYREWLTVLS